MGERIQTTLTIIRLMRRSEPKYFFEHAAANILLSIVLLFLPTTGGSKLWLVLIAVLLFSLAVQSLRFWRYTRRQDREREECLRRAMQEVDDG